MDSNARLGGDRQQKREHVRFKEQKFDLKKIKPTLVGSNLLNESVTDQQINQRGRLLQLSQAWDGRQVGNEFQYLP